MDSALFKILEADMPRFNPLIANGLAVEKMRLAEQYIDQIFRCAEEGFPEGLKYLGPHPCTPEEEYMELTRRRTEPKRRRSTWRNYEISKSDLYMMRYDFEYEGEVIKRYLQLPYVREGGIITLRDSTFTVSPVLADRAVSVGDNVLFIPLTMARLNFEAVVHHFYKDGKNETVYVVGSKIYNRSQKSIRTDGHAAVRALTTLAHYLFCRYGLTGTFKEFANATVKVGGEEINSENYPPEKWVICSSIGRKPTALKTRYYAPSSLRLAIPREQYNHFTASLIGGFFFVVDLFPDRMFADYVDETRLWKILLGHLIFPSGHSEGKLADAIETHLKSVDGYLDEISKDRLRDDGIFVRDIYQLFAHVIETFTTRMSQTLDSISGMYNKRLTVLRYVLFDVVSGIFNLMFQLRNASNNKKLTKREVIQAMNYKLRSDLIMGMSNQHGEVNVISNPGDNKVFKMTSNLVLQTSSSGLVRGGDGDGTGPSRWLHASIAEVGSYGNLPKSEPTGRGRINPYVEIDHDGLILRKEKFRELLDHIQRKIQR